MKKASLTPPERPQLHAREVLAQRAAAERAAIHQTMDFLTKRQAAELLQCSTRQIELLTQRGRLAAPVYLGDRSPRWIRSELVASLCSPSGEASDA